MKKQMKLNIFKRIFSGFLMSLFFVSNAYAQSVEFKNPIKARDIKELVNQILEVVVDLGAVIVVFCVVYAGYLFVAAQGDPGKLNKAKEVFFWTIVGGMIVLGAYVLSEVIQNTVNQIKA